MTIYYLMVKTHNITGLKYLCQTKRKDPYKYLGSGVDWITHLTLYGKSIRTDILLETSDKRLLTETGRHYSMLWNITTAMDDFGNKIWANIIPESGGGPGRSGHHVGKNNPMYGKVRDDLKSETSPNKNEYRREQSRVQMKERWSCPIFKKEKQEQRRKQWTDPEYKEKMKGRKRTNKKVNINGVEYDSLGIAAASLGLDPSTISKRCSSRHNKFANWNYI